MKIFIKYCGGCNCQIDRSKIVSNIQDLLGPNHSLTTNVDDAPYRVGIMACGCPSACAWNPDIASLAKHWVILAGKTVDTQEFPEPELAAAVVQKIKEL